MLQKATTASGLLMSPPYHQGRKGPSSLCSRAPDWLVTAVLSLSHPPAPQPGAGTALSASPRSLPDFPSLWHKVIKGQSYH